MNKLNCIVHYKGLEPYSPIKVLSEINIQRIHCAKKKREEIGGFHLHEDQINLIPEEIDLETHGIHLEPCYKRFTVILGNKKFNTDSNQSQSRKSKRLSSPPPGETSSAWVYPNDCQLCGKCRLQYKNKRYVPYTIATFNAAESIKAAAKVKNETLFNEIEHLDLIAKEFKVHHVCYKKFTLGYSPASRAENLMEEDNELKECMYRKANFEEVVEYIRDSVLHLKKAASMKTLQEISGIESSDRRYRQTLKKRIEKEFGNQITFLSSNINLPEIIVSSEYFTSTTVHHDDNSTLKLAAKILQNDIIAKYKENPTSTWPPTANDLESDKFKPPNSVIDFMKSVLSLENRSKETSVNMTRMAESFAQDLVFGVTRGKVLQLKHFLLALGLHSLSGSRKVIDIVSKFGHCLNYNLVCEIETSQAELAQKQLSNKTSLPLQPISSDNFVYTHFWVDNFDVLVDKQTGGGSIHTTHLVAFQEKSTESLQLNNQLSVSRRKSRDLPAQNFDTKLLLIERKKNPPSTLYQHTTTYNDASFNRQHFLWIFLRKNNSFQQTVPIFKGWMLKMRSAHKPTSIIEKTIETYLPPINAKVTEFGTIQRYMIYLQKLASEVNMTYVNITLDVGAAMNAFLVTWNAPELFNNIIIHLGGFHFLKENFQVIGCIVRESGFEDIIFEAGVCTSGSLQGVLAGSHYNRCWNVHNVFSESLERVFLKRFLLQLKLEIPHQLSHLSADPQCENVNDELFQSMQDLLSKYDEFREKTRRGFYGETAQFWLIYMDLMRYQLMGHSAIQENDHEKLLHCWQHFIPMYFALNKLHYARYGSYYVESMRNVDSLYPGMKELLSKHGLSVQGQDSYCLKTAADQRGEQTINKDAKTAGGIKGFSTNENNVLKWCLSRPQQAINMNRLKEQAGVAHHQSIYKPLRISQIERSESLVSKVVNVLENNFLNPFAIALDGEELVNLSSGEKFHGDTTELLNIWKNGRDLHQQFLKQRIYTNEKGFHDPISRQKQVLFSTRQNKPKQENKTQIITANRNILGKLLSLSLRSQQQIDFSKALGYSLYPVPLSLSFPDGTRRQTQKSKLLEVLSIKNHQTLSDKKASTLVIDMIAQFRSLTRVPETFEDFIIQFLDVIPKSYIRVDIVADCYREVSIKSSEREKRGQSSKVLIGSVRSKVPRDIAKFFSCSANKTQLIDLTFNYVLENTTKVLAMLQATCIILSGDNLCHEVRSTGCFQKMSLCSDQEEADTKVVLHALDALANNSSNVVIRSPSGDTDIFVIALGVVRETSRIKFDYGSGINRKAIWLNEVAIPVNYSKALIGFHAFTGNDYVSAFFRKGKSRCWKTMVKSARYLEAFNTLGDQWELSDELKLTLEEYVCNLYSSSKNYVNETRFDMFMENQIVKNQIVDLSILPPCKSSLLLHIERANYVAKLWKMSPVNLINAPPFNNHGWHCDGSINWVNEQYPDDISELLINDENDSEEYGDDDDNEYGDGFDE